MEHVLNWLGQGCAVALATAFTPSSSRSRSRSPIKVHPHASMVDVSTGRIFEDHRGKAALTAQVEGTDALAAASPILTVRATPPGAAAPRPAPGSRRDTWDVAARTGGAIGRGSQKVAVATTGFLARFGRKIAHSF